MTTKEQTVAYIVHIIWTTRNNFHKCKNGMLEQTENFSAFSKTRTDLHKISKKISRFAWLFQKTSNFLGFQTFQDSVRVF